MPGMDTPASVPAISYDKFMYLFLTGTWYRHANLSQALTFVVLRCDMTFYDTLWIPGIAFLFKVSLSAKNMMLINVDDQNIVDFYAFRGTHISPAV